MNLAEFKAWFDGYTEDMDGAPSKKQWERIKARVAEIDGTPVTHTVYVDRYVRPYWQQYYGSLYPYSAFAQNMCMAQSNNTASAELKSSQLGVAVSNTFDGIAAMYAAGKAEAAASEAPQ